MSSPNLNETAWRLTPGRFFSVHLLTASSLQTGKYVTYAQQPSKVDVELNVGENLWGLNVGYPYRSDHIVRWFGHPIVALVTGSLPQTTFGPNG